MSGFTFYVDDLYAGKVTMGSGLGFPENDGNSGDFIVTDGNGVLSFKSNDYVFTEQNTAVALTNRTAIKFNRVIYNHGDVVQTGPAVFVLKTDKNYILEYYMTNVSFGTDDDDDDTGSSAVIGYYYVATQTPLGSNVTITKTTNLPSLIEYVSITGGDVSIVVGIASVTGTIKLGKSILKITQVL